MTPAEAAELKKYIEQIRRGALQLTRACEMLANYLDLCYINKEYLEPDETATFAGVTE